jgi:hypothetical protein
LFYYFQKTSLPPLIVPDSHVLIEKIVRLQRQIAKKQEKLDFVEEHVSTMTEEVKKKNRIIQTYMMTQMEAGTLSSEDMDENKVRSCMGGACKMGLHHWQCRDGGAQYIKTTSGKDSVIEGQPLLLFM